MASSPKAETPAEVAKDTPQSPPKNETPTDLSKGGQDGKSPLPGSSDNAGANVDPNSKKRPLSMVEGPWAEDDDAFSDE